MHAREDVLPTEYYRGGVGHGHVFISYSRTDKLYVEGLAAFLQAAGCAVWYDFEITVGDPFAPRIQRAIEDCVAFVPVLTPAAAGSTWVRREISYADGLGKPILPILLIPCATPIEIHSLQYEDAVGEKMPSSRFVDKLLQYRDDNADPGDEIASVRDDLPARTMGGPATAQGRIWNVPARNHRFTGRQRQLGQINRHLQRDGGSSVLALFGIGGIGKTQVALEYAHRFAFRYAVVWWMEAGRSDLIGAQVASLAIEAGLVSPLADPGTGAKAALAWLRGGDRWLLIFDDAIDAEGLMPWLPAGSGHVLITSRNSAWEIASRAIEVDVPTDPDARRMLRRQLPTLHHDDARNLAKALGNLPLGLAQATGFLQQTGMSVSAYVDALTRDAAQVLDESTPPSYSRSLAAAVRVSCTNLGAESEAALQLVQLCAFMAPEPIPTTMFTEAPVHAFPSPLSTEMGSFLALWRMLGLVGRYGLARITTDGAQFHVLVQAIVRDVLPNGDRTRMRRHAEALIIAAHPGHAEDPSRWLAWSRLVPHLLSLRPAESENPQFRSMTCDAIWWLIVRRDTQVALELALSLRRPWIKKLGADDDATLWISDHVGRAYRDLGQLRTAREIHHDVFNRRTRFFGSDHPATLAAAANLAMDISEMGLHEDARLLRADTLERCQRTLGVDHPLTTRSANNLAEDLRALNLYEQARQLDEDNLERKRRLLGADHPYTYVSVGGLALDLHGLNQHRRALELEEEAFAGMKRLLGADHHDTIRAANHLAIGLQVSGEPERAYELAEDTITRATQILGTDHPETKRAREICRSLHSR